MLRAFKTDREQLLGQVNNYEKGMLKAPDILDMFRGLVLTRQLYLFPKPYQDVAALLIREGIIKEQQPANDN